MKFKEGQEVMVLDTTNKPAATGKIISFNPTSGLYKVKYKYLNSEKEDEAELQEQRLITHDDIVSSSNK
jgi:hypothetical protein